MTQPVPISQHFQDLYPSVVDIELSIERELLNEHVIKTTRASQSDFVVPDYLLDFGPIILESSVCYTVLVLNYGPTMIEVKFNKQKSSSTFEENDFRLEFRQRKFEVGQTAELFVLFKPTKKRYGSTEKSVEEYITLSVGSTSYIRIVIKAVVTMPRINLKYSILDFGQVDLGVGVRRSIVMKNEYVDYIE